MTQASVYTAPELATLMSPKWNAFIPHAPTPKQHAALLLDSYREVLYGGAAGGGKSDYLLMSALQYVDVPGYRALILRRTFPQLAQADSVLPRLAAWLGGKAVGLHSTDGTPSKWKFPSGAQIECAHVQYEKDRFNFQSGAWQFIGFDELTQFSESIYLYLFSRLRRLEGSTLPLRVRGATNPGGVGHEWVSKRFGITDGQLQEGRVFIPAKLDDNPHLDRVEYETTLSELHPYERAQLLEGDWHVRPPGSRFQREWFRVEKSCPAGIRRWVRRWDLAATEPKAGRDPDWTVGTRMGQHGGVYYIRDVRRKQLTPAGVDRLLLQTAQLDGVAVPVRIEQEPGASGKIAAAHFAKLLAGFSVRSIPSTGDKVVRSNPFASQAEAGNVVLIDDGTWDVEGWLRRVEMFPTEGVHDDEVDSASGALADLTHKGVSPADLYGGEVDAAA